VPTLPVSREQLADQCRDPGADLVPDLTHSLDVLIACGIN
jgi:hypothetical protein